MTLNRAEVRGIRIGIAPDAFNSDGSDISINFHHGTSANGIVLAKATIQGQSRPAAPTPATTPITMDPVTGDLTVSWNAGTQPAGARPDHYTVKIQDLGPELKTGTESITIRRRRP